MEARVANSRGASGMSTGAPPLSAAAARHWRLPRSLCVRPDKRPQPARAGRATQLPRGNPLPALAAPRRPLAPGIAPTASRRGALTAAAAAPDAPSADALQSITLLRSDGTPAPLLSLWEERKALVAWVRHYGCLLCRKRCASLAAIKDHLDAAGVSLAVIGPANVDQAATFLEQTKFPGEVYADPDHASFDALQFAYGPATVLNPKAGLNLVSARLQGFEQDWGLSLQEATVSRGGWQQGGVMVAGPGADNIAFLFRDKEAGDEPEIKDVLAACCGVPASA